MMPRTEWRSQVAARRAVAVKVTDGDPNGVSWTRRPVMRTTRMYLSRCSRLHGLTFDHTFEGCALDLPGVLGELSACSPPSS
jgi:hypothetical protein